MFYLEYEVQIFHLKISYALLMTISNEVGFGSVEAIGLFPPTSFPYFFHLSTRELQGDTMESHMTDGVSATSVGGNAL